MTDDPRVTWLRQQLGYEEGGARQASTYASDTWTCISTGVLEYGRPNEDDNWPIVLNDGGITQHIADHDPATVLRSVRARRRLLEHILSLQEIATDEDSADFAAKVEEMLLLLLAPYAGSYGWQEAWRVAGLDEDGAARVLDGELAHRELPRG